MVALALTSVPVAASAAPADERVAIVEARPIDLPDLGPLALRESVINGVKAQGGIVVVGRVPLPKGLAACDTVECYETIAKAAGAVYVLRIDGIFADDRYELQLSMWSQRTGQIVSSDRDRCKLCLAEDVLRAARIQTAYVVGKAFASQASEPVEPPRLPAGMLGAAERPGESADRHSHRWLGWTLGGAGVLAGVTSVFLFAADKQKSDCGAPPGDSAPCAMQRRTLVPALAFGAGALGGIVAGGIILLRGRSDRGSSTTVTVNPYPLGLVLGWRL